MLKAHCIYFSVFLLIALPRPRVQAAVARGEQDPTYMKQRVTKYTVFGGRSFLDQDVPRNSFGGVLCYLL